MREKTIEKLRELVDKEGLQKTSAKLRIARSTLASVYGSLPVREGTILLVQERIEANERG